VKKVIGQDAKRDFDEMRALVDQAAAKAVAKKRYFVGKIKGP
jgi:hydrogenase maturation factor HypE